MIHPALVIAPSVCVGVLLGAQVVFRACMVVMREAGEREAELEAEIERLELWNEKLMGGDPTEVPDVADSSAWSATQVDLDASGDEAKLNDAFARVLAHGDLLRRCAVCREPAMLTQPTDYVWIVDQVWVTIAEECQSCGAQLGFQVRSQSWACMEAMRAWEGCRTATALFQSEQSTVLDDLAELDAPVGTTTMRDVAISVAITKGIPRKLMKCTTCKRWVEPYDGTLPCDCVSPNIVEG